MIFSSKTARVLLAAFLATIGYAAAPDNFSDQSSGLINARAIRFNPTTKKVYVVDEAHAAVEVIDTVSQAARRVAVGNAPVAIDVDSTSGRAYVANAGDGTVSVLDGSTDVVLATVAVGSRPYSIAVNSVTGVVYVSHTFSDKTTLLNGTTHAVVQVATGSIDLIAIDPVANIAYLLAYEGGNLTLLEGPHAAMRKLEAGKHAWGMALNEATHTLYVARTGTADVIAMHGTSSSLLPAGRTPCAVAVNARTNTVYVANYADRSVTVLNGETGHAAATVPVGEHPQAVAVDAQRNLVYVANTFSNSVTVIDGQTYKAVATLPAGKAPYALAVDPGSSRLYVANEAGNSHFTIVDTSKVWR